MSSEVYWKAIQDKYLPGKIVRGKIAELSLYGIYIELEYGLRGFVHRARLKPLTEIADYRVGTEIEVNVLSVDTVEQRVHLTLTKDDPFNFPRR